ncbi:MAG: hypothetical protein GTN89_08505 [Acidobacteria bacterium]|nr:hypothetical protein [Acidobacteriota bacterium]NIM63954.1 hypothetical protein [Acidobacteriota bacterium]NIO59359.1 hypothetical protein [Acidobacteriota bacterium]NIQ30395.1 hypothetical protein [Acidobacteriota bacterium]NIQ85321.1 hypothetical protein [Acidobacteriota bacterium]
MLSAVTLILLAAAVLWFVAAPLLRSDALERERVVSAESEAVELQSRHAMLLASLADLEEDRGTGKLSDEDYERLKESLTSRAIEVMKKIDALPEPGPAPLGPRPLDSGGETSA